MMEVSGLGLAYFAHENNSERYAGVSPQAHNKFNGCWIQCFNHTLRGMLARGKPTYYLS